MLDEPLDKPVIDFRKKTLENSILQIAVLEARQHQETLQGTLRTINRIGILGPLLSGLLLLLLAFPGLELRETWYATVVVSMMTVGGLLLHYSYIEFFEQVRYKYSVLYPRLFAIAGHQNWINYLEFTAPRSLGSWVPSLFYSVIMMIALMGIWIRFILNPARESGSLEAWGACVITAIGLLAITCTIHIVLVAARTLERDVKLAQGRIWYPPSPFLSSLRLIPCGDGLCFMVAEPLKVSVQRSLPGEAAQWVTIEVPKGFNTDLASVPRLLWPIFPPWERYGPAALLHDYLYSLQEPEWPRADADRAFMDTMRLMGVPRVAYTIIYLAVRGFGGKARIMASRRKLPDLETQERLLARFSAGEQKAVF